MKFNTIICSYLFFALLVFNALALLSAEFLHTFSQVFMLLSHNGRVYNLFSLLFIIISIVLVALTPFAFYKGKNIESKQVFGKTAPFVVSVFAILTLALLLFLFYCAWQGYFFKPLIQEDIAIESVGWAYYRSINFFIALFCSLFLCILPLIYNIFSLKKNLHMNMQNRYARALIILEPKLSTIIITIAANSCHPFFANVPSKWASFFFLLLSIVLLLYLLSQNPSAFGFYDFANIIFLAFMIMCVILCSESLLRSNFLNAQNTMYMLAILSWCSEWMQNKDALFDKMT